MNAVDLNDLYGIHAKQVYHNLSVPELYEHGVEQKNCRIASNGALVAYSHAKTGRSPNDKRVVQSPESEKDVWWGKVNIPLSPSSFELLRKRAFDYFDHKDQIYIFDGFAGSDPKFRIKVRIICTRPYHSLFMHNMLIRPTKEELHNFGTPDYVIFNAGCHSASTSIEGVTSKTSVALSFEKREMVILGTEYAGEMKKGVFTIMNYLLPKQNILSMHCSANQGKNDDVTIFFGLSGTGKTTLSTDPNRMLIGDDEHYWTEDGIYNIEGGCYAKCIDLSEEKEPDIYQAIRFGAIMENVILKKTDRSPDYSDSTLTENTRVAYPITHINNIKMPSSGPIPKNIVFLVCDAFGILPPVSKLSPEESAYWFVTGYTAKVAGTEMGVKSPEASFSACFGSPFLVWHPHKYGSLLSEKIKETNCQAWLINTGWIGGGYGEGERIELKYTRRIIDAIHSGSLIQASYQVLPVFNLHYPEKCEGVPDEVLCPHKSWSSREAYDAKTLELAKLFNKNFSQYESNFDEKFRKINPQV